MEVLNKEKIDISMLSISPDRFGGLIELLSNSKITKDTAKKIFNIMLSDNRSASQIMQDLNLTISVDENELKNIVSEILSDNPDEFKRLKDGEQKLIKFFMGAIMKHTKGKYPPNIIIDILNQSI